VTGFGWKKRFTKMPITKAKKVCIYNIFDVSVIFYEWIDVFFAGLFHFSTILWLRYLVVTKIIIKYFFFL